MSSLHHIYTCLVISIVLATVAESKAATANDAQVEIIKQRLVKFPEDVDPQRIENEEKIIDKDDEAKRILQEIAKINQALGYVKKQSDASKIPPLLDSSQYLYPNPSYSPFQSHQTSGINGEALLLPSIRAIDLNKQKQLYQNAAYNVSHSNKQSHTRNNNNKKKQEEKIQYYFRPNQVQVPAPTSLGDRQQLPAHFVIPVHPYKLNKEEYLRKYAPQEYLVKGYKIVGDIDNFYGKTQLTASGTHKASPKYHLFFLPRELALKETRLVGSQQSTLGKPQSFKAGILKTTGKIDGNASREEKLALRPLKGQQQGNDNLTKTLPIIKKRIAAKPQIKPQIQKEPGFVQNQHLTGGSASSTTTVNITPPPLGMNPQVNGGSENAQQNKINNNQNNGAGDNLGSNGNGNGQGYQNTFNLFSHNKNSSNNLGNKLGDVNGNQNLTNANAIKMAFQNIFKFPFRPQEPTPLPNQYGSSASLDKPNTSGVSANYQGNNGLESVPLQVPQKVLYQSTGLQPQVFYGGSTVGNKPTQLGSNDYNWEDDSSSASENDSASNGDQTNGSSNNNNNNDNDNEDYDSSKPVESEKIWGLRNDNPIITAQKETQKEALKQGGIIIQKLKVRKGGIAIAGPGGVATAGSGGTAIVGPGGYALTHPRSLTIAGPGAKVIAIPASVDLREALQRTNLAEMIFPREGKIVATGPTVYYAPDI